MADDEADEMQQDLLSLVEVDETVYLLFNQYEDGDLASAMGNVQAAPVGREEDAVPVPVLITNDATSCIWASDSGSLWVASAEGSVGTTAKVRWPAPPPELEYVAQGRSPKWSATMLPSPNGLPLNATAIWGTSDRQVFVGAYGGHICLWDGQQWSVSHVGPDDGNQGTIHGFAGNRPDNVFAVGATGVVLHFDGARWRQLPLPGVPGVEEDFTGIVCSDEGEVITSSTFGHQSRLLQGSAGSGLHELTRCEHNLLGMARLGTRLLFAADDDGVAELKGKAIKIIKDSFSAVGVVEGKERAYFFEPAPEEAGYIEYDPREKKAPWWGVTLA